MRYNKLVTIFSVMMSFVSVNGQIQHGYVKTLGRPGCKGTGIYGVSISVLESPNTVLSNKNGKFDFTLAGKKDGDEYTISRIQKNGYELVDKAVRGRRYGLSAKVPLEIIMVSSEQLDADKRRIENNAYTRASAKYKKQYEELKKRFAEHGISEDDYSNKQQELGERYQKYLSMIDKMAETYALTNYDNISTINKAIYQAIENGDFDLADSLISSKGSFGKRENAALSKIELGKKLQREGKEELQDLAIDYYNKHTIFAANFQNDSAAYYLERRAKLDSTNIGWQLATSNYISDYLADFSSSMNYATLALRQSVHKYGEANDTTAICYDQIALLYNSLGNYDKALEYENKALDILSQLRHKDESALQQPTITWE